MSILRTKAKPNDLTAKMPLRLEKDGAILKTKDGIEGYVEYWADDALAIKNQLAQVTGEYSRLFMINNKRSVKENVRADVGKSDRQTGDAQIKVQGQAGDGRNRRAIDANEADAG